MSIPFGPTANAAIATTVLMTSGTSGRRGQVPQRTPTGIATTSATRQSRNPNAPLPWTFTQTTGMSGTTTSAATDPRRSHRLQARTVARTRTTSQLCARGLQTDRPMTIPSATSSDRGNGGTLGATSAQQPPGEADREGRDRQRDEARAHQPGRPVGGRQDDVPRPAVGEERLAAGQPAEDVGLRDDAGRQDRIADPEVPAEVRVDLRPPGRDPRADEHDGRDRPTERPVVAEQDGQSADDSAGSIGRHVAEMVGHARPDAILRR